MCFVIKCAQADLCNEEVQLPMQLGQFVERLHSALNHVIEHSQLGNQVRQLLGYSAESLRLAIETENMTKLSKHYTRVIIKHKKCHFQNVPFRKIYSMVTFPTGNKTKVSRLG